MKWENLIAWAYAHDLELFLWMFLLLVTNGLIDY